MANSTKQSSPTKQLNPTKQPRGLRVFLLSTSITLLSVGAATAAFMPGGMGNDWQQWVLNAYLNPLAQLQEQLQGSAPILDTIMKTALGDSWNRLSPQGNSPPDPYAIRTDKTQVSPTVLGTNAVVKQGEGANLYDQELSRAISASVLGTTGQQQLEQKAKQTSGIVESTQQGLQVAQRLAQEAQSLTSTQDVMKNNAALSSTLAGMLTNQSRLEADNHAALLKIQQLQGITAQLSANTSAGIDESNRRSRVNRQMDLSGASQTPMYIPGLYRTGNPSQP
jgi:hypothetical protein